MSQIFCLRDLTTFILYEFFFKQTLERILWLLEVENTDVIIANVENFNEWGLPLPAVIMVCTSLRGALLWILNTSCFVIVIKSGKKLMKHIPKMPRAPYANSTPYTSHPPLQQENGAHNSSAIPAVSSNLV